MWDQLDTNHSVGGLFPNDGDGNAWGDPVNGFPPALAERGYTLTDPGRYQNLTDDFSAQINAFRQANAEIVTGVPIPPDFTTFWTQSRQQGFVPNSLHRQAIPFPQAVEALGDRAQLFSEVWWSPSHRSNPAQRLDGRWWRGLYHGDRRQWTQPIGFVRVLFELGRRDGSGQ